MLDKKILRKKIYSINKENRNVDFSKEDKIIINKLINSKYFIDCDTILLYYPLYNEVNVMNLINYSLNHNKKVGLPKTYNDVIEFTYIDKNWENNLITGLYNTIEPQNNNYIKNYSANTLAIIPALAYGKDNSRIGHGKGYYDKFLAKNKDIKKIGLCRSHLLFNKIPMENNDIYLDDIISSN